MIESVPKDIDAPQLAACRLWAHRLAVTSAVALEATMSTVAGSGRP